MPTLALGRFGTSHASGRMNNNMTNMHKLKVFSGRANRPLAEQIAERLGDSLGKLHLSDFPDGETRVAIEEDVRGRDIFIVQPTCPPVNDNLMELLIILDAFKRSSASRITAVIPYYGYARQDRKDQGRVPITAKLVADLLTQAGADRVLTLDLHAAQIQGFFNIPVDHLFAVPVIKDYLESLKVPPADFVILSPDEGNIKKSVIYQKKLGGEFAIVDKRRLSPTETRQANIIGASLVGKTAVIFDDMISTAGTLVGTAEAAKASGAKRIYACATHGIFCGEAINRLRSAPLEEIIVTNSIPLPEEKRLPKIRQLSVAGLLANAIRSIHLNESVSRLFE
jgi:ribose-phosphate pyrophosphokinase